MSFVVHFKKFSVVDVHDMRLTSELVLTAWRFVQNGVLFVFKVLSSSTKTTFFLANNFSIVYCSLTIIGHVFYLLKLFASLGAKQLVPI